MTNYCITYVKNIEYDGKRTQDNSGIKDYQVNFYRVKEVITYDKSKIPVQDEPQNFIGILRRDDTNVKPLDLL